MVFIQTENQLSANYMAHYIQLLYPMIPTIWHLSIKILALGLCYPVCGRASAWEQGKEEQGCGLCYVIATITWKRKMTMR